MASMQANNDQERRQATSSVRFQQSRSKTHAGRLLIRNGEKEILLRVSEIDRIEADTYYSRLHMNGKQYMLRETMTDFEARRAPTTFVRVHCSSVVNIARVREIHREGRLESSLELESGAVLKISRQGRQRLLSLGG